MLRVENLHYKYPAGHEALRRIFWICSNEKRRLSVRDMLMIGSCAGYAMLIVILNYA